MVVAGVVWCWSRQWVLGFWGGSEAAVRVRVWLWDRNLVLGLGFEFGVRERVWLWDRNLVLGLGSEFGVLERVWLWDRDLVLGLGLVGMVGLVGSLLISPYSQHCLHLCSQSQILCQIQAGPFQ